MANIATVQALCRESLRAQRVAVLGVVHGSPRESTLIGLRLGRVQLPAPRLTRSRPAWLVVAVLK